jgi:hypothetical protein
MALEIQVIDHLGQAQKCGGLRRLMRPNPTFLLHIQSELMNVLDIQSELIKYFKLTKIYKR